jgi:hypothetical protein
VIRKQIYIGEGENQRLKAWARELNIAEAQLVRTGITRVLDDLEAERRRRAAWRRERRRIMRLIEQGPVPGGRTWRREDLYDRERERRSR